VRRVLAEKYGMVVTTETATVQTNVAPPMVN